MAGYVPSVKKHGFVRIGNEQKKASKVAEEKYLEEQAKKAEGVEFDKEKGGDPKEKTAPIEDDAQWRLTEEKAVKVGDDRDKALNSTEQTLRFGLFMLTFMYFRAMSMVKREEESWSGKADMIGNEGKDAKSKLTAERKRMIEEERAAEERRHELEQVMGRAKVGEERKRRREAAERAEAARQLYEKVRLGNRDQYHASNPRFHHHYLNQSIST